jgi:hypothetical protein
MKKLILLSIIIFLLAACQKEAKILPKVTPVVTTAVVTAKPDTIPDKAAFKLKLCKDSVNTDETLFAFNHLGSLNYSTTNDAPYFTGFGQVNLASISADGVDLTINNLPYTSGMLVGLDVHTKTDGAYFLKLSYEKNIPANIQIWIKDTYLKDSINVCSANYHFNVAEADANSFGKNRFKVILKDSGQQQTTLSH